MSDAAGCSRHVAEQLPCRNGNSILADGCNLSIPAATAAGRYDAQIALDDSAGARERRQRSRDFVVGEVDAGESVNHVNTGYGGGQ